MTTDATLPREDVSTADESAAGDASQQQQNENQPAAEGQPERIDPRIVPPRRAEALAAIAARRRHLREELDEADHDSVAEGTEDAALERLKAASSLSDADADADSGDDAGEPESTQARQARDTQGRFARDGAEDAASPSPAAAAAASAITDLDPDAIVRIKVDGEIQEVRAGDLLRDASKVRAADARFEEASRLYKAATGKGGAAPQRAPQDEPTHALAPAAGQPAAGEGLEPISTDEAKKIAATLQYGSEEEATKAVADLVATVADRVRKSTDPTQIAQQVASQIKRESDFKETLDTVAKEFKTVVEDPDLRLLAAERVFQMRASELQKLGYPTDDLKAALTSPAGRQLITQLHLQEAERGRARPQVEVLRGACKEIATKFRLSSQPARTGTVRSLDAKREAKRAAPQPPTPAQARGSLSDPQPPAKKASDVIAGIKKARGQL